MSRREPVRSQPDQIEGRSRRRRPSGLGPVGSAVIDLIGASLASPAAQPQPAIWAKL
jgi:hypothetical protein